MVAMMGLQCSSEGGLSSITGKRESREVSLLKRAFFADGAPSSDFGLALLGLSRPIIYELGNNYGDVQRSQ